MKLRKRRPVQRRRFLAQSAALAVGGALAWIARGGKNRVPDHGLPIRPPGALANDDDFKSACVHCGLCGVVCETGTIGFFGLDETEHGALTPVLDVRRRACSLCMHCVDVCPSGALRPTERTAVRMGTAVVDPELCISYLGRACGYCHDACPLPNVAIKLVPPATPIVMVDGCVGCGRCVEQCPQTPRAIDVVRIG